MADKSPFSIESQKARIRLTTSCRDADGLPRVDDAGSLKTVSGQLVQTMHNGVLVVANGYVGEYMTEIIRQLRGVHEPQEELVFHLIVERLKQDTDAPVMIELGAFWSYYSLWFSQSIPSAQLVCVEPDPNNLAIGERNMKLNDKTAIFISAAISDSSRPPAPFSCESDGQDRLIPTENLESIMANSGVKRVDLLLLDIQGAELSTLEGAQSAISRGDVRFVVVSTHHQIISGDPLTHQKCLEFFYNNDAHIIAEHTVSESFSGDGLIAVSFDERDSDLIADISYCRAKDSLFGDPQYEIVAQSKIIGEQQEVIKNRKLEIESIYRSRSWKISRKLSRLAYRVIKRDNK